MIFYFSATGNSKYVASRLAEATQNKIISITDCLKNNLLSFNIDDGENIGIISPTYAWGIPSVVSDFLKLIKVKGNNKNYTYFIATYGTTPGNSGIIANELMKAYLNIEVNAYYSVKMPDTWTPIYNLSDKHKVSKINDKVEPQLDELIKRISNKSVGDFMRNKIPKFTKIFYEPYYNNMRKTKKFKVECSCIGCGLCAKNCPVNAIEMKDSKPIWIKKQCTMCLGCLHHCPKFSIQYGNNTKKHGQYHNPHYKY